VQGAGCKVQGLGTGVYLWRRHRNPGARARRCRGETAVAPWSPAPPAPARSAAGSGIGL